jgi:hypothetical protein
VFEVTVQLMSDGELRRLEVLQDLARRRLTPAAAGQLLGLERRLGRPLAPRKPGPKPRVERDTTRQAQLL